MSFQSHTVHGIVMHVGFVYEAHKHISTSRVHLFVEIIKGLWVTVYRYFTLVGCGNIPQISRQGLST